MTSTGGPQFHGDIHGSQIAIGNHDVFQRQYVAAQSKPDEGLTAAVRALLTALEHLGLHAEEEVGVRQDAEAALEEAAQQEPDVGRLRRLLGRIQAVLVPIAAGAAAGTATGLTNETAQLAQTVLTDLQHALP
ncbi:hypothetical protein EJ357_01280 [Streptomyces cyaneochromogenes]|uniref:Uncharacterized protein n=1 Tax=Streptomyces cyaneochromogenes TaxID=2496836 RepID=A0A3S5HT72_9ACTN|nr:hypothetical protein [Streptomyces cyaneochromogenes]AZQ32265.1 hypothetical protein EJ357_01280 [Streptomyces cyaneochromogenes]